MIRDVLYVFIGGGAGSVFRFAIGMFWQHLSLHPLYANIIFPWPTFVVNILGCLLIGILYRFSSQLDITPEIRLLLGMGFCGGFTTFSTFSYESTTLLAEGHTQTFVLYVLSSIVLGGMAAWLPSAIYHI